jgi:hypothetical protein
MEFALNDHLFLAYLCAEPPFDLWLDFQVLLNRNPDIIEGFFTGGALAATAGQIVAPNGEAFL